MNSTLDSTISSAIESELAAIGSRSSRLQNHQRRARTASIAAGGLVLVGALTGASVIVNGWPGERTITPIADTIASGTYVGDATIELGQVPAEAAFVTLDISCDSGGVMSVETGTEATATGASWNCSDPLFDGHTTIDDGKLPASGSTSIVIKAEPGTRWSVKARYATSSVAPLGVNANGQTYGVMVEGEPTPDLTPVQATNGLVGYAYSKDMWSEESKISVYLSDGETVIGEFVFGDQ